MPTSPHPPPSYEEATVGVIPRRLPPIQHQHVADMSGETHSEIAQCLEFKISNDASNSKA